MIKTCNGRRSALGHGCVTSFSSISSVFVFLAVFAVLLCCGSIHRNTSAAGNEQRPLTVYRSHHLVVHSDLPADAAKLVLRRMETAFTDSRTFWDREIRGQIQCYVVQNLDHWQDADLPHPLAKILVGRVGGAAIVERAGAGMRKRTEVYVLASAQPGVAEHEVVHAYCGKAFGTTGPIWYREGMAQLLANGNDAIQGINLPDEMIQQLKASQYRTIQQVVRGDATTTRLLNAFNTKMARQSNLVGLIPLSDWNQADVRSLETIHVGYSWDWLLCHLLYHNPNYRSRFESLGRTYLAKRQDHFGRLFSPILNELTFEYQLTLKHLARGYRVDLCRWDWEKRSRLLNGSGSACVSIAAARGYQASGVELSKGCRYRFNVEGTWSTGPESPATDANGDVTTRGVLEAVVFKDCQLSTAFDLGSSGNFRAPCNGHLFLRCKDDWNRLSDNTGDVRITFTR